MRYRAREVRLLLVLLTIANPVVVALGLEFIEFLVEVFPLSSIRWSGAARRAHLLSEWEGGKRKGAERGTKTSDQNLLAPNRYLVHRAAHRPRHRRVDGRV